MSVNPHRRRELLRQGLCPLCAAKPLSATAKLCEACRDHFNELQRERNAALRQAGLCLHCMEPRDAQAWLCSECLAERRAARQEKAAALRAAGLCTRCKAQHGSGHRDCAACEQEALNKKRLRRLAAEQNYLLKVQHSSGPPRLSLL